MTFARIWILHFLWLLPLLALALIIYSRQKKKATERFADPEFLIRLTGKDQKQQRFLKRVLLLVILGLMLFALAGPRWGSHLQEVSQKGVDIMILVDVSRSMLVQDIKPNRLERAKQDILGFLDVIQGGAGALYDVQHVAHGLREFLAGICINPPLVKRLRRSFFAQRLSHLPVYPIAG